MEPVFQPDETAFAPAARAGEAALAWQRNAFLSDSTAVTLLEAMPGPAMVLNRQRQILAANSQIQVAFSTEDCERLVGRRPGEVMGCVRSRETANGCGTTAACEHCGSVRAVLQALDSRGRATGECRIRTSFRRGTGAYDFRVFATWARIGGEEMVVLALQDTASEKRRRELENVALLDRGEACPAPLSGVVDGGPEAEAGFKREFGDLSSRVLEQIEWHRQLLAAETGMLEVGEQDVNVRGLLERLAETCRAKWSGRGREIAVATGGSETVRTDPGLLARVEDGLLRNALEATPEGGRVDLRAEHDGDGVVITVHNEGAMAPEVQHQVFQRSFSTKHGEGRGIGTYSVKLLVERYLQGDVGFTSEPASGTVFTVAIPDREPRRAAA